MRCFRSPNSILEQLQCEQMESIVPHDRLSELPKMLRLHILSFLPRKYAIRTGVLSSQWRDLWRFRFPEPNALNLGPRFAEGKSDEELVQAIDEAMRRQGKKKIEIFHLFIHTHNEQNDATILAWIQRASANAVEEAHLDFSRGVVWNQLDRPRKLELTENLFAGNLIAILSLRYCKLDRAFSFSHFQYLEILFLHEVNITDCMIRRLVAYCALLSTLDVRECSSLQFMTLSAPRLRLKTLVIMNCWDLRIVKIHSTALRSLFVVGTDKFLLMAPEISSLVDVIMVSVLHPFSRFSHGLPPVGGRDYIESMAICGRRLQYAFGSTTCPLGDLQYFSELQLIMVNEGWLLPIYQFLGQSNLPRLSKLFIELPTMFDNPSIDYHMGLQLGPPEFIFNNLRTVRIKNFKMQPNEMLLLEFILAKAAALELIMVMLLHDNNDHSCVAARHHLHQAISRMRKTSADARVMLLCSWQREHNMSPPIPSWLLHGPELGI